MPMYDFKCKSCEFIFEDFISWEIEEAKCPKCFQMGVRGYWTPNSAPGVNVARKHQSCPKDYDTTPGDEGIPFGEVPGDEDYEWMKDPNQKFGPSP